MRWCCAHDLRRRAARRGSRSQRFSEPNFSSDFPVFLLRGTLRRRESGPACGGATNLPGSTQPARQARVPGGRSFRGAANGGGLTANSGANSGSGGPAEPHEPVSGLASEGPSSWDGSSKSCPRRGPSSWKTDTENSENAQSARASSAIQLRWPLRSLHREFECPGRHDTRVQQHSAVPAACYDM